MAQHSARLAEVLGEPNGILAGVSGQQATIRVAMAGEEISPATVIALKKGLYGRDLHALRKIGRAYARELAARYGDEMREVFGEASEAHAPDWLAYLATGVRGYAPLPETAPGAEAAPPGDRIAEPAALYEVVQRAVRHTLKETNAAAFFLDAVRWINQRTGKPVQLFLHEGTENLTAERAMAYLRDFVELLREEGIIGQNEDPLAEFLECRKPTIHQ